jgi:hypothetical protein
MIIIPDETTNNTEDTEVVDLIKDKETKTMKATTVERVEE